MGRASQAFDYLTREALPSPRERSLLYTHIYDLSALGRARAAYRASESLGEDMPHEDAERTTFQDRIRADLGDDPRRMRDIYQYHRHTD